MALDDENLTTKVPPSDAPLKTASSQSSLGIQVGPSRHSSDVEVPSALPHYSKEDSPPDKEVLHIEQIHSDRSESLTERTEEDRETETEATESDSNIELTDFGWHEFQLRYRDAIQHANEEESKLLQEFEKYFDVFRVWSIATSQRDSERAWKRLKTRQRYVELAEDKLEERKDHYELVVMAFKNALALLKQ